MELLFDLSEEASDILSDLGLAGVDHEAVTRLRAIIHDLRSTALGAAGLSKEHYSAYWPKRTGDK
jgi:ABC-type lipopolysaccharide export system ATPase subunit